MSNEDDVARARNHPESRGTMSEEQLTTLPPAGCHELDDDELDEVAGGRVYASESRAEDKAKIYNHTGFVAMLPMEP